MQDANDSIIGLLLEIKSEISQQSQALSNLEKQILEIKHNTCVDEDMPKNETPLSDISEQDISKNISSMCSGLMKVFEERTTQNKQDKPFNFET